MNPRVIIKKVVPEGLFRAIEPYGHWVEAFIAQSIQGFPARRLKVIGVTGTDGKTSSSVIIHGMLKDAGLNAALMTTISVDYGDGAGQQANPTRMTTVGALELAKKLKKIQKNGAEWLVLETTSHALAQHRTWGVPYSVAVMTNISHEHLDYHGTFENYLKSKRKLFELCNANNKGLQTGVINADDEQAETFASAIKNPVFYGMKKGDLKAENLKLTPGGSRYSVKSNDTEYRIECHLPGGFNVYNSLTALAVGRAVGLSKDQIERGIASVKNVEGRMAKIEEGQDFTVIIDYAHTPDSFEKLFNEMRPVTEGKLIVMFGSAGRRDEAKRSRQGEVAGRLTDIVIVTEEDDRDMDGQEILEQIASGAKKAGKTEGENLHVIHSREEAVQKAIDLAEPGDTILLLGKGHETSIFANGPQAAELRHLLQNDGDPRRVIKRPYDESAVTRQAIKTKLGR